MAVVRAGELSGSLPVVLDTLTVYLEKTANLRRKVRGAIAYPAVILTVALGVVFIMVIKIVPIFENVYARANAVLPAPTRTLIWVSGLVRELHVPVFLRHGPRPRRLLLRAVRRTRAAVSSTAPSSTVPLFGRLVRKAIMARMCRTLGVLLNSGIPLIEAMETVSRVAGNRVIEHALHRRHAEDARRRHHRRHPARDRRVPEMVIQLVATGEESGTLPAMLGKAPLYYEQQVDNAVATLSTLIEPVMIVVMGAIAGSIIFALYLPIFTLGQALRGGVR